LLEEDWNIKEKFPAIAKEIKLEDLINNCIESMLEGKNMGRTVVKL
jgi:hypothetical protein